MSLVTDLDYLIHRLRLSQLKVEDQVAGRTLRFDQAIVDQNDYIKTTSTSYPEMQYCSSPDIIPGLPEGPLLAYRQINNLHVISSAPTPTPPPSRSRSSSASGTNNTIERKPGHTVNQNSKNENQNAPINSLKRQPVPSKLTQDISVSKSSRNNDENLNNDSITTPASTSISTAASSPFIAPSVGSGLTPFNLTNQDSSSDFGTNSSLPTILGEEFHRHPHHQRMLSVIPELSKEDIPSHIDSDVDEDDIELDYEDVTEETKKVPIFKTKDSSKITEKPDPNVLIKPVLPRKFSHANMPLTGSHLAMAPGVVYPKSRMRSLSSSSLVNTNPLHNRATGNSTNIGPNNPQDSSESRPKPRLAVSNSPFESPKTITPVHGISLLTAMIDAKKPVMNNPFLGEFASFTGQGELAPLALQLYLPHSSTPNKPLPLTVRRDASVENVIGFALYTYYDKRWQPPLTPQQSKTSQWTMRIVEDDGSIDEDFPALERTRQIEKFAFDQFALCEVSPAQAKANELAQNRTPRETSSANTSNQTVTGLRKPLAGIPISEVSSKSSIASNTVTADTSVVNLAAPGNSGPLQMIKIQLFNNAGVSHTTTLNVAASTSLVMIKAAVCRKWNLTPEEYELTSSQSRNALDPNAILEGLLGITELSLVKRSTSGDLNSLASRTPPLGGLTGPYTPSGLPFIYRHYTVFRRMPMFVNKQERVLAIDGYYLHVLPPAGRGGPGGIGGSGFGGGSLGAYASTKTSSYHISALELCRQGRKVRRRLKLVFSRSHDSKTYDFEAASQDEADEICTNLNFLLHTYRSEKHTQLNSST